MLKNPGRGDQSHWGDQTHHSNLNRTQGVIRYEHVENENIKHCDDDC